MVNCLQCCFNSAFKFNMRRYTTGLSEYGHSKHDRAASILTLRISQYIPALGGTGGPGGGGSGGAANASTPAQHLVSTIVIADTPGAEPLAMDPGVLRLREGARLNRAVTALASVGPARCDKVRETTQTHGNK